MPKPVFDLNFAEVATMIRPDDGDYLFSLDRKYIHHTVEIELPVTIEEFVTIEAGCKIAQNVHIRSHCRIGRDCVLLDGVIIKCGAILGPGTICREKAFIGPNVVTTSNLDSKMSRVDVGEGSFIGAGSIIMPGVRIGPKITVGALTFVDKDLDGPPGSVYVGAPARRVK